MKQKKLLLISGPCVIESESLVLEIANELKSQLKNLPVNLVFKASFDKANRSSGKSYRGPGLKAGLRALEKVKDKTGLPILTDFHTPDQAEAVAEVADFLQVPAFLCRQTDMIVAGVKAAAKYKRRLNIKKGQFLAPWDSKNIIEKARNVAPGKMLADWLWLTERGTCFGYNALIVDMISFQTIQSFGVPVIYDATHSIQTPGAAKGGSATGGKREYLEVLARAAIAAGADGLFMECHPQPSKALSDGPNAMYLDLMGPLVKQLIKIRETTLKLPKLLPESQAT